MEVQERENTARDDFSLGSSEEVRRQTPLVLSKMIINN